MNESVVLLVGDLAWPVVVLVIGVIVLITQRAAIAEMIGRLRSFKVPGGEAELTVVSEVGVITTAVESLSRDVTVPQERGKRPAGGQLVEPIQNREPIGDVEPLAVQEVPSLVVLRTSAAITLEALAYPPPPGGFGTDPASLLDVLRRRGVLDREQATALGELIQVADQAASGAIVSRRVALAVQNSGQAIIGQLDKLRAYAGPKFEEHVLEVLRDRLPVGWLLDIDRAIPRDGLVAPGGRSAHARVDALVIAGDRSAVVEVRARLRPGADGQVEAVREWLSALPPDLPVLLVMLGERLTDRELRWICSGHMAAVELLLWDREPAELIMTLRELLNRAGVTSGLPSPRTAG